ncbi:hypothetical protein L210DRAFT_3561456 [Boletus edulis BED1]|uniref:Uncharacterized protein n=1 Tax=Boletus edulis BED1 TaxID=1328754 RepID=A0AAD4BHQ6_BOLED|nr:hypothetical protein L210DRAFT_3561456 [Boletus edulis BED1]
MGAHSTVFGHFVRVSDPPGGRAAVLTLLGELPSCELRGVGNIGLRRIDIAEISEGHPALGRAFLGLAVGADVQFMGIFTVDMGIAGILSASADRCASHVVCDHGSGGYLVGVSRPLCGPWISCI